MNKMISVSHLSLFRLFFFTHSWIPLKHTGRGGVTPLAHDLDWEADAEQVFLVVVSQLPFHHQLNLEANRSQSIKSDYKEWFKKRTNKKEEEWRKSEQKGETPDNFPWYIISAHTASEADFHPIVDDITLHKDSFNSSTEI